MRRRRGLRRLARLRRALLVLRRPPSCAAYKSRRPISDLYDPVRSWRAQNDRLDHKVRDRTRELEEAQHEILTRLALAASQRLQGRFRGYPYEDASLKHLLTLRDGRKLTAHDFVYHIVRVLHPLTGIKDGVAESAPVRVTAGPSTWVQA